MQSLPCTASNWVKQNRPKKSSNSAIYKDDKLMRIPNVGKVTIDKLKIGGITHVNQLVNLPSEKATELAQQTGLSTNALASVCRKADTALPGSYPNPVTDHRAAANPYKSWFGDEHISKIECCAALSPFVCITKLVLHIMYQTKRMMVGTTHQDDWFFYHDALSLMISKGTMDWMEKTVIDGVSIKDRWLVPQNGVNGGTVYEGRPVGNSPEFMPLDNSLNADIKRSHDYHCAVTWHCATGDRRKFSMSTPRLIARGIR